VFIGVLQIENIGAIYIEFMWQREFLKLRFSEPQFCLTLLTSIVDTVRCGGGGGLMWSPWLKSSQPEKQKEGGRK